MRWRRAAIAACVLVVAQGLLVLGYRAVVESLIRLHEVDGAALGADRAVSLPSHTVTVQDMVNHAKMEITDDDELAWTLWALSRYLPPDAEWLNKDGEPWSIERIVETQVRKPINNRTYCGGTHCLFALAHSRNIYLRSGKPLRGIWLEADQKIKKHIQIAKKLQNRDGMFSTD